MKKISKKETIKKMVLRYLGKNRLMALGTAANNKPWAATVFYAFDKEFNLIFYSRPDTKHCQHLKRNPFVSVVINHDWKNADGTIKGLQITGKASKVSKKYYPSVYALYKKRFKWVDEFASDHIFYLVKPVEIWYIDQKLFGHHNRVRVV
ncbi:MAG: pyridoxamine 5'-phosphate oxidase family protein [Candidatus Nealsonbacteria bacterium]|nr:pyridoxamine 5'-phosphate oxidase family protein [Candidatus Nealsonbacteria bacterium]